MATDGTAMSTSPSRKRCALIGERLGHSYSADIHRCWDLYDYELRPMPADEVPRFLQAGDFDGLNVTIPYKQLVIPHCDDITPQAQAIGSVNTIVRDADGHLHGANTDYFGFAGMARRAGIDFAGRKVVILGNGGTTRTVQAVAADAGARAIVVVSRRGPVTYDRLADHTDADILVNATPVGMYPETDAMPADPADFPSCTGVLDVIYNPARTRLIQRAERLGIPCASGLWMLVEQARVAGGLFMGQTLDASWTERVWRELSSRTLNVVLIGMPGCGKTTVGELLRQRLERELVDCDAEIVRRAGKPIADIFADEGEARFRDLEAAVIAEAAREHGRIIVTGGGAVLREQNRLNLRQNGRVFRLERRLETLAIGQGRPLSTDLARVAAMAAEREPLYRETADATIDNNGTPEAAAEAILARL